jgi:hypothetical protein
VNASKYGTQLCDLSPTPHGKLEEGSVTSIPHPILKMSRLRPGEDGGFTCGGTLAGGRSGLSTKVFVTQIPLS